MPSAPKLALYEVRTFDEAVSKSLWRQRLQGNVLSMFAALALIDPIIAMRAD